MPFINVTIVKSSPDEKVGLSLQMDVGSTNQVNVSNLDGLAAASDLQLNDRVVSINGTKVDDVPNAIALIKSSQSDVVISAYRFLDFEQLVADEFAREFNILWLEPKTKCVVEPKNNPDDCTACCCPGLVQKYSYTLTLLDGRRVQYVDNLVGTFNRMQAGMAAGNGNASQVNAVARMENLVAQMVSRMESRLIVDYAAYENGIAGGVQNASILASTAVATDAVAVASAPITEAMVREDGPNIADEIAKLKSLYDSGALTEAEYKQAKMKVLSS